MIDIKQENILEIPISLNGIDTGEVLRFDVDDIELPLRYEEMLEKDKKNKEWLQNQIAIIQKKQNKPAKNYLSSNEKEAIKVSKEFFEKEAEIYNMFLGENGIQKLLCGRKLGWLTLYQVDEIIETYILPQLDLTFDSLKDKLIAKYSTDEDKKVI